MNLSAVNTILREGGPRVESWGAIRRGGCPYNVNTTVSENPGSDLFIFPMAGLLDEQAFAKLIAPHKHFGRPITPEEI
jgi:hypothetical protein